MDGYLTKPFRLSALYDGIKQLIPNFVRPTRSSAIAARPSVVSNGRSHSKESLVHLDRDAVMSVAPDVNSLRSLVRTFQELGPGVLEEVGQAVAELDHERLREAAHKLGGAMLQFFWQLPIDLAAQLETMGVEEHLDGAPSVYARLAGEFTRLAIATSRLEDVNKP
jgi:hypothetical protein